MATGAGGGRRLEEEALQQRVDAIGVAFGGDAAGRAARGLLDQLAARGRRASLDALAPGRLSVVDMRPHRAYSIACRRGIRDQTKMSIRPDDADKNVARREATIGRPDRDGVSRSRRSAAQNWT